MFDIGKRRRVADFMQVDIGATLETLVAGGYDN